MLLVDLNHLEGTLSSVNKLNGYSYYWNNDALKVKSINDKTSQIGLVAQEVEEIYPEFVQTDAEGMKSVNYSQMVAVLIEAVKELNAKVEGLEKENDTLTSELENRKELEKRIAQIEKLLGAGDLTVSGTINADK